MLPDQIQYSQSLMEFLGMHGIDSVTEDISASGMLILDSEQTSPETLRNLGFRVGTGLKDIRYLLYKEGHFCGILR